MREYSPQRDARLAVAGLLAAFMAGVAANVSAFNTVVTYDLWSRNPAKDRDDGSTSASGASPPSPAS